MGKIYLLLVLVISFGMLLFGQIVLAAPAGICHTPSQYGDIRNAIDEPTCSHILVEAGIYPMNMLIERDIVIEGTLGNDGEPATILEGTGQWPIILVLGSDLNVTLRNMVVRNGNSTDSTWYTGGLHWKGDNPNSSLMLDTMRFYNNYGSMNYSGGTATITNSVFSNNYSTGASVHYGAVQATNIIASNNSGSGLSFLNTTTYITNVTAISNTKYGINSILSWNSPVYDSKLTINHGDFRNNGAVGVRARHSLSVANSQFINNKQAINNVRCCVYERSVIENSTFIDNEAIEYYYGTLENGGALHLQTRSSFDPGWLIRNSTFESNSASNGGAIYIGDERPWGYQGGGNLTIENSTFTHNQAISGTGGAISTVYFNRKAPIHISQTSFDANTAAQHGGAISYVGLENRWMDTPINLFLNTVTMTNNLAGGFGGGMYYHHQNEITMPVHIMNSTIVSNSAASGGGLYLGAETTASPLFITDTLIAHNSVITNGGAIVTDSPFNITSSTIVSNTAQQFGGGIFASGSLTKTSSLRNSSLGGNQAAEGDSIYTNSALIAQFTTIGYDKGQNTSIFKVDSPAMLQFDNSILAGQLGNATLANCGGAIDQIIGTDSVDSDGSCFFGSTRNLANVNPQLETLADNGGTSPTFGLLVNSPAIGMGNNCIATDQRGVARPVTHCDAGAFQTEDVFTPTAVALISSTTTDTNPIHLIITINILLLVTLFLRRHFAIAQTPA